ncbi:hypothetical protein N9N67_01180 [Bacteriovoracaceae bacterium]|nr:hypothetical protein [Bacteriovoracaceae bacterium]
MKIISLLCILSFSFTFGQTPLGELKIKFNGIRIMEEGSFERDGYFFGALGSKVTINRNIKDVNEEVLEQVKLSLLNFISTSDPNIFEAGENPFPLLVKQEASAISFHRENLRMNPKERYKVSEIELIEYKLMLVQPIGLQTEIFVKLGISLGYAPYNWTDNTELILSEEELQNQIDTREHFDDEYPGDVTAGSPITRFKSDIGFKRKNIYFKGFFEGRSSGNYTRWEDNNDPDTLHGYYYLFNWENRSDRQLGLELGMELRLIKNYPKFSLYATFYRHKFKSWAQIAEQGNGTFYDTQDTIHRPELNYNYLKVGFEIPVSFYRR